MFDKLALTQEEEIDSEKVHKTITNSFPQVSTFLTSDKYYGTILSFRTGQMHLVSIHVNPRIAKSPTRIEINPSKYESYNDLTKFLSLFCRPEEMTIRRIDHTVDLSGVTVESLKDSLLYSRKKWKREYATGKELTGFTLGSYPEVLCVYDKGREQGISSTISRLELAQYQQKVPFKQYSQLKNYLEYCPFSQIKSFRLISNIDSEKVKKKHFILSQLIKENGFQSAYKLLNSSSNFKRDFSSIIEEDKSFPNPSLLYQQNLKKFFMEDAWQQKSKLMQIEQIV